MIEHIIIPCIEVAQPIGTFYIGVINSSDLCSISFADIRRPEGRELERYIGTQRDLSEGRVAEIRQYVTTVDACFPTSIIIAVSSDDAGYDKDKGILQIRKDDKVAKIIDGQHRIAGLRDYSGPEFQLNVTIFIDMDIEDQAMVFATINLKQTKVTKSLAYDLYEYTRSRSPQKTCHNIARLMNFKEGSPFHHRIKILGKATGGDFGLITQATFVDRLLKMISIDVMDDRDRIKRGETLEGPSGAKAEKLVFRQRFIEERDAEIAKIIWNYFKAVSARWPIAYNSLERGMILARTTGFAALMRVLPDFMKAVGMDKAIPAEEEFSEHLKKSRLRDADFTSDRFKPGSSGEGELVSVLQEEMFST